MLCLLVLSNLWASATVVAEKFNLSIPSKPIAEAVKTLSYQTKHSVLFQVDELGNFHTKAIKGKYSLKVALNALLEGTNLEGSLTESGVIVVSLRKSANAQNREEVLINKKIKRSLLASVSVFLFGTGMQSVAMAQDAQSTDEGNAVQEQSPGGLEEITVTARRYAENLQVTAGSVTAFTANKIAELGIKQANDLQNLVPNLTLKRRGGSASRGLTIKIRGIGTSDVDVPTADPSVGVYTDGIIQARAFGPQFELFDIERIEILRGPQGTLYGKNTLGGAINIITRKPDGEDRYKAYAGYGNFNALEYGGSVDFTLMEDKLFASVAGLGRTQDGFYENTLVQGQELADKNLLATRFALRYVGETVDLLLTQDVSIQRNANYPELFLAFVPGSLSDTAAGIAGENLADFIVPVDADFNDRRRISVDTGGIEAGALPAGAGGRGDPRSDADFYGTSLIAEVDNGGDYTFKSLTGYRGFSTSISQDLDGTPVQIADQVTSDQGWQFSQEFQVNALLANDRLNFVGGVFWLHEELETQHTNPFFLGFIPFISPLRLTSTNTDAFAAFVHGVYSITDDLKITAGLRYNKENKRLTLKDGDLIRITEGVPFKDQPDIIFDIPADGGFGDLNESASESFGSFQPKFGIEYTANENLFLYGLVSRGYASGGFNGRVNAGFGGIETFGQELLWNYEVGFKSDFLDNRVRINVSAFFIDYSNIVVQTFGASGDSTNIGFFLQNAGAATVKGFEVEFAARPIPQLLLRANLGILDQQFDDFGVGTDGVPIDPSDLNFFDSPDTTISLIAQYEVDLPNDAGLQFSVDWSYRTETFFDNDGVVGSSQPGYDLTNARITYKSENGRYEVGLWVKNLFQETYLRRTLQVLDTPLGFASGLFGDPRTFGFTFKIKG